MDSLRRIERHDYRADGKTRFGDCFGELVRGIFKSSGRNAHNGGAVIGIVQMLCVVLCIAAALISVIIMLTKKPKRTAAARYLLDAAGNVLTVSAIVFFEMYCFWG